MVEPLTTVAAPNHPDIAAMVGRVLTTSAPTLRERRRAARLDRILGDPEAREVLMGLTDEVLRIAEPRHAIARLEAVAHNSLRGFGLLDRSALRAAVLAGRVAPRPVKALVDRRIIQETSGVIFDADRPVFPSGFARNVNLLGEAILGDAEADERLRELIGRIAGGAGYVSVKISALCANLDVLAFEHSVARISERLRTLYRAAMQARPAAFVNLDMEEYRDLSLTVAAFTRVLDEAEFRTFEAGIVLQAYLPDSFSALTELAAWARRRRDQGGAAIKVRLVKGANLAMETVEAELHGWDPAPYPTKVDADANLKRLVLTALDARNRGAVRIGLGSHNLFDIAWTVQAAEQRGQRDRLELEMLAGMAPAQARAVRDLLGAVRLYLPIAHVSALDAAISYLARRLDENAAPENFLRNLMHIAPGTEAFAAELARFDEAIRRMDTVSSLPRRTQDRQQAEAPRRDNGNPGVPHRTAFANSADTDFTVAANREWIARHLASAVAATATGALARITTTDEVDRIVSVAHGAQARQVPMGVRRSWLDALAAVMEAERGTTISLMAHETGKTVREGDPECSEAIDAVRFAASVGARTIEELASDGLEVRPAGTVVIAPPWNFPYAIPTLSLATALVAGNAVIVKPSGEAQAVGVHLVAQCRRAGIPEDLVQVACCADGPVGTHLVSHDGVDTVVLTGSSGTARKFLDGKPAMHLLAETSGKNALIVTDAADIDAAIRDVVRSAFGHAGQKCSAASLLILVGEVAERADVLERLADAVRSIRVGAATDPATMMGPLIGEPNNRLHRAFTTLEPGERWLVQPRLLDRAANIWTPGVRVGVTEGSWFHLTECFGPVLGVMAAPDLATAVRIQNATAYGLTGGIHSLDPSEVAEWLRSAEVGNAYVNRHITGAIVQRQPFGGWKASSVGGGSKPGGPDHVLGFVRVAGQLVGSAADASFTLAWGRLYGTDTDPSGLAAEHNVLRHHRLRGVLVHLGPEEGREDVREVPASLARAATLTGTPLLVSRSDDEAIGIIRAHRPERLRVLSSAGEAVLRAAHEHDVAVDRTAVTGHGRIELGRWLKEQSISITAHRHGRISTSMQAALDVSRHEA